MEPILTKKEISELLRAVKEGRVSTDLVEYDQNMARYHKHAENIDLFEVFSFVKSKGARIPNIDIVLDDFARNVSISTTNLLQRTFTVTHIDITVLPFNECLTSLNNKGAIAIYNLDPIKNGGLIHVDNELAFIMLELMLGSSSQIEPLSLNRSLTTIEKNLFENTMRTYCQDLSRAFKPVLKLNPSLVKVENNFRLVQIVDPNTEVIIVRFKVKILDKVAQMLLIIPYESLEPLRSQFKDIVNISNPVTVWTDILHREILEMSTTMIAQSGTINMNVRQVLNLKPGDFLQLDYDPDQPLTIVIEDKPKFFAVSGKRHSKKAVHIKSRYSNRQGAMHGYT